MPLLYRGPVVLILSLGWMMANAAEPLPNIIDANREGNRVEAEVQREIQTLSDARRALFEEYDALNRELASLSTNNTQLQRMLDDQDGQRRTRALTLEKLTETRREIVPLLLAMADWLEQLTRADLPYRVQERRQAVTELRQALDRGDLDLGTGYERLLDQYSQAMADGEQVEVYSDAAPANREQAVDYLQVGRLALFYQSPDGQHSGQWDVARQQWVKLDADQNRVLTRAMRIVRKETPPDLLHLPLPAATAIGAEAVP